MTKKIWFYLCMTVCLALTLQSCQFITDFEKVKPEINQQLDDIEILSNKLTESYAKHKKGELTTIELQDLTLEIRDGIKKAKESIVAIKSDSVGWGSMIAATVAGLLSRGVPSKGPLAMLFGAFTARRKED